MVLTRWSPENSVLWWANLLSERVAGLVCLGLHGQFYFCDRGIGLGLRLRLGEAGCSCWWFGGCFSA